MKLIKDFGVRALLAVLLVVILAVVILPPAIRGTLDPIQAAQVVSPLVVLALTFYFAKQRTP